MEDGTSSPPPFRKTEVETNWIHTLNENEKRNLKITLRLKDTTPREREKKPPTSVII